MADSYREEIIRTDAEAEPKQESVLVADDDPMYRRLLERWLSEWNYRVTLAIDGTQAWQLVQQESSPNLLILDWIMPGLEGPELCRRVRNQKRSHYAYILLVTAKGQKDDMVRGLDSGADDFVSKPFSVGELRARLNVGRRILSLQDQLIRAREELRYGATHDWLTGLWNRGAITALLEREVERSRRSNSSMGLLMVDIDHFKKVNDTYGHAIGDAVLQEVAKRIAKSVRSYDLVGRYGGEEFLVLLSDCSGEIVLKGAERIRREVADSPIGAGGASISVTISIGTMVSNLTAASPKCILAGADAALYNAKQCGRNCVKVGVEAALGAADGLGLSLRKGETAIE